MYSIIGSEAAMYLLIFLSADCSAKTFKIEFRYVRWIGARKSYQNDNKIGQFPKD